MRALGSVLNFERWQSVDCPGCQLPWMLAPGQRTQSFLCPDCEEDAFVVASQTAERATLDQRIQLVRSDLNGQLRECGTPALYAEFTRTSWEAKWGPWGDHEKFSQLVGWPPASPMPAERLDDWLIFLHGNFGRRKTGLATAILGEALCRGFTKCRWEDMNMWLRELREDNFTNYDTVWWRAAGASFLIFDGIGDVKGARLTGEFDGSWWTREVAEMIRYRHAHAYPTVVTSNGSREDLGFIARGLPSRMNVPMVWKMGGRDFRAPE